MATIPLNYSSVGQVFLNDLSFLNKATPANGGNGQIQVAGKVYNVSLTTDGIQVSPEKSIRNFFSMSAKSTASAVQADLRDQMQTWLEVQKPRPDENLSIFKSVQSNIRRDKDYSVRSANENAAQTLLTAKAANVMGLQLHQPVHAAYGDASIRHNGTQAFLANTQHLQQQQQHRIQFNSITIDTQNKIVGVDWDKFGISGVVLNNGRVQHTPNTLSSMLSQIRLGTLPQSSTNLPNGYTPELSTAWTQLLQKNVDKLDIIGRITTMRNNNNNNAQGFDADVRALVRKNMSVSCQARLLQISGITPQQYGTMRAPTLESFARTFANALQRYEQSISNGGTQQQAHAQAQQAFAAYPADFQQELSLHLDNIVRNAVFRQTSKLGLELYKQQGIPVVFQWRDHSGQDNSAQVRPVNQQDWWRTGFTLGTPQVMPITMSEQRHVERLETSGAAAVRPADNIVVLKV
ncbi:hypothetical protein E8K88_15100 [Lampropedia aestuarii]|uniref:Uncharacterized protein n=1 Tax=Lampropedia aestuarii TaxID=2562762 RepID=A0A4S5BGF4_9BURK|nr:hypothetical protein [Lampropedia aestuarii]THJ31350.1 hypothetical protein E8K88_15100 [Lampropedia aestuarii]